MIFIEDERIKLNGVVLPGLIKSIEVTETAKVDEQEVEGSATKPKQATGYEDAKVIIELIIDDTESQTKYERYAVLREIFRKPGQNVPQPIPIVSEDTAAHGIEKVIFKKLTHKGEQEVAAYGKPGAVGIHSPDHYSNQQLGRFRGLVRQQQSQGCDSGSEQP